MSIFKHIALEISGIVAVFPKNHEKTKLAQTLFHYITLAVETFTNYYLKLSEDNPKNPVLHYSHYIYPSPTFQELFDDIFSPQVMQIILEHYLPIQQCSFLFQPSSLDIFSLSSQLQIFLSKTTKPIISTLYYYSYFSFICSKPPSLELTPLHTYCTQNSLLTFSYIFEYQRFEDCKSEYFAQENV